MTNTLILVEGNNDVNELKSTILSSPNHKIISFDFLAHNSLKKLSVQHSIVEEYFSADDQSKIDNLAVNLATTWYKHEGLTKLLEYNGLNFGTLLELEILPYFFLHLKRMLGIIRIIEKEKPLKIISSSLGNFVDSIIRNQKIVSTTTGSDLRSSLYHDSVEIPISLGGTLISLKISKKQFLRIKKIFGVLLGLFFNYRLDLRIVSDKKSILLLDFNPVSYPHLLRALSNASQNVILLNQRRPAIWNLESLKTIKRSNCKIIELEQFVNSETLSQIEKDEDNLKNKLFTLWSNHEILSNTFSIEGYSFWNAIKNNFIEITTKRFEEGLRLFILSQKLFEKINVSCILEWAHTGTEEKVALHIANKRRIPIILLQHGLYILNNKFEKYLPILPILPSNSAKEAVWGNIMKNYLLEHKVKQEDTLLSGSPRHDIFFKRRINTNSNTVLVAFNGLFYLNFSGNDTRTYDYYEKCIKRVFQILNKIPDKKPIVKLHPAQTNYDVRPIIREINSSIPIYQNQNIIDLIESCDVMISLSYSTALLDAMILGKPTMLVLIDDQDFEEEILVKRKATLCVSNIDDLESSLKDLLFNHSVREQLIKNGKEFVSEYLTNQGRASEHLANILKNY